MPTNKRLPTTDPLRLLTEGTIEVEGRLPWSSNGTFLVRCSLGDEETMAVYKPQRGEVPLWDFPGGLFRREVAAYELSVALGWDLVPETIARHEAPFGPGSLQRFIPADFSEHYFTLEERPEYKHRLSAICAFDVVANNADRKSGHCILGSDGKVWAIDHGLCFHSEPKLRTVIWELAGSPLPEDLTGDLAKLSESPPSSMKDLLNEDELNAISLRAAHLIKTGKFPEPDPYRHHYPWPPV